MDSKGPQGGKGPQEGRMSPPEMQKKTEVLEKRIAELEK